jgi:hypothetical protein
MRPRLLERRERWSLTWAGWLLLAFALATLVLIATRGLCAFLSVNDPVGGQFLVVESWLPRYAYREAAVIFREGNYRKIIVAGVLPVDADGEESARIDLGAEDLVGFGVPRDRVMTAPSRDTNKDRTFYSAVAVGGLLLEQGQQGTSVDVVTVGPHARRSRLLYEEALGQSARVGIICLEDRRFDAKRWWDSSEGVRTVVDEAVAYLYARIYFSPRK